MAFWTYILLCADGKFYTGHTEDLEARMGQHQSGLIAGFTARRMPVKLVWADNFPTRLEALEAELKIKKWSVAKKRALITGDWGALSFFARPPRERGAVLPRASTSLDTNGSVGSRASTSLDTNAGVGMFARGGVG